MLSLRLPGPISAGTCLGSPHIMVCMETNYEIRAIDPEVLRELRRFDDAGNPPRAVVEGDGGSPLRCCLKRSEPGERVALVSYAPVRRWAREAGADPGPYDEVGPVFIHTGDCGGPTGGGYPTDMRGDRRVLRAYSVKGSILGGRYVEADGRSTSRPVDGSATIEGELRDMYLDPKVATVHVRAVEYGCFLFETRRKRG